MGNDKEIIRFSNQQRTASLQSLWLQLMVGWAGTDIALYLLYRFSLTPINISGELNGLLFALKWQVFGLAILLAMVYTIVAKRGFNIEAAVYPLQAAANGQDAGVVTHNAVLRNSIEQWAIFLPLILLTTVYLVDEQSVFDLRIIPLFSISFVLGRIIYWAGYVYNSLYRVFGMAMTLHLSLYMVVFSMWQFVQLI